MRSLFIACALVSAGMLGLQAAASAHGGTYRGPGDTVPPGGGGGGGAPGAPVTGNPGHPGSPTSPTGGPVAPSGPNGNPNSPTTSTAGIQGPDLTIWQYWWGFNREPYLNLKSHLRTPSVTTGSAEFFIGQGQKDQARDLLRPSEETIRTQIVPALLRVLERETSNDIVTGALVALARIGDSSDESGAQKSQMAEVIRGFVKSGNQEIQETATVALGILANEANIPLLEALLQGDSARLAGSGLRFTSSVPERTRAFAAYGLGLIGHKASEAGRQAIVSALIRTLEDGAGGFIQRDIPVACLSSIGLTPLPLVESGEPVDLSSKVARPQGVADRQAQILWLLDYFESENQPFLNRAHVPTAIARLLADVPEESSLRREVALRFVERIGRLAEGQNEVVQSLVLALGRIGDCDADEVDGAIRATLMAAGDSGGDVQVRHFALIALAQVAGRPGTGAGSPLAGLEGVKGKSNPRGYLLDKLSNGNAEMRSWAALALAILERSLDERGLEGSEASKAALAQALVEARAPAQVGALALAVGLARVREAQQDLRDSFVRISEPEARGTCAIALGLMGDRGAIELIAERLRQARFQPDLLRSAAIGLGLLGDKAIVQELVEMLQNAQSLSSQAAVASALGFIGDSNSIEPLIGMLEDQDKTARARGFAAVALGIVADKEDLPWNAKLSVDINYRANTPTLTSPEAGTGILDIL